MSNLLMDQFFVFEYPAVDIWALMGLPESTSGFSLSTAATTATDNSLNATNINFDASALDPSYSTLAPIDGAPVPVPIHDFLPLLSSQDGFAAPGLTSFSTISITDERALLRGGFDNRSMNFTETHMNPLPSLLSSEVTTTDIFAQLPGLEMPTLFDTMPLLQFPLTATAFPEQTLPESSSLQSQPQYPTQEKKKTRKPYTRRKKVLDQQQFPQQTLTSHVSPPNHPLFPLPTLATTHPTLSLFLPTELPTNNNHTSSNLSYCNANGSNNNTTVPCEYENFLPANFFSEASIETTESNFSSIMFWDKRRGSADSGYESCGDIDEIEPASPDFGIGPSFSDPIFSLSSTSTSLSSAGIHPFDSVSTLGFDLCLPPTSSAIPAVPASTQFSPFDRMQVTATSDVSGTISSNNNSNNNNNNNTNNYKIKSSKSNKANPRPSTYRSTAGRHLPAMVIPPCPTIGDPIRRETNTRKGNRTSNPKKYQKDIHTAIHACQYPGCLYRFNKKREFVRHQRTHLYKNRDPFACATCNASLCRVDAVKRHMQSKSKKECLKNGWYYAFDTEGRLMGSKRCARLWYEGVDGIEYPTGK